jgi:hypothetical protein
MKQTDAADFFSLTSRQQIDYVWALEAKLAASEQVREHAEKELPNDRKINDKLMVNLITAEKGMDDWRKIAEQAEAQAAAMRNCTNCGRWDKQHKFCSVDEKCLGGQLWQSKFVYDAGSAIITRLQTSETALREIRELCKPKEYAIDPIDGKPAREWESEQLMWIWEKAETALAKKVAKQ